MEAQVSSNLVPWNKGKLMGQKAPLKAKEVWAIRTHLEMARTRSGSGAIDYRHLRQDDFVCPSRIGTSPHLGTRQHARILHGWVTEIGLDI